MENKALGMVGAITKSHNNISATKHMVIKKVGLDI
jgi:hypothetical protein